MALVGNLKDLKLPSLIQLNCMERNTAKLTIEHNGRFGFVYFEKGQVVHAEYDPYIGEEAIYQLLTLYAGNFKVESGIRPPVNSIKTSWNNLLLEGMHQMDLSEDDEERKYTHLFERLLTIRGVQSAVLLRKDGSFVAGSADIKKESGYLFSLVLLEAQKFGEIIRSDKPDFVSVAVAPKKYILSTFNQLNLVLELDVKIKLDLVLPLLKQALG